jgi:predicted O-linked N-acetylglucosamine transferase (SPINDLY family)
VTDVEMKPATSLGAWLTDHPVIDVAEVALAICDWARVESAVAGLPAAIAEGNASVTPFALLSLSDDPALQRQCAENYIKEGMPPRREPLWTGTAHRGDRIRLGYLSADFQNHATAYLAADLFELHDRSRFEVLGFSFGRDDGSEVRRRLMRAFDHFHDVQWRSDREIAQMLHDLNVDIAIDLKGHTRDARPAILSYRPAPIAVNYLGYPGTMGADFIDYIIADPITAPFAHEPFFTEKIVHLPFCYQPNSTKRAAASHVPQRSEASLPEQGFVFCSFNNSYKITAPVFDVWMRLMQNVPGVLWLLGDNAAADRNLRREALARGIDPARLIFAPRLALDEHLARHRLADLFLDTLPINAHTTASDALWAGLPVVTCRGNSFVARVAASILSAAGLPELVTENLAQYEACALRLATDRALMASVRQGSRTTERAAHCSISSGTPGTSKPPTRRCGKFRGAARRRGASASRLTRQIRRVGKGGRRFSERVQRSLRRAHAARRVARVGTAASAVAESSHASAAFAHPTRAFGPLRPLLSLASFTVIAALPGPNIGSRSTRHQRQPGATRCATPNGRGS